jgi:hypothetical protein
LGEIAPLFRLQGLQTDGELIPPNSKGKQKMQQEKTPDFLACFHFFQGKWIS